MPIYYTEFGDDRKAQRQEIKSTNNPLYPEMTIVNDCEFCNMDIAPGL